jgi:glycosyltransferase involved in cell wall biosynthesis
VISVLLPYRDATSTLAAAVASVLADLGPTDECVLVDDGSSDGSDRCAKEIAATDERVVRVTSGGIGVAGALEHGRRACRGDFIARMDADDVSLPGRFAAQRRVLERDASLAVVATQIELFGSPGPGIQRYVAWQNGLVSAVDHAHAIFVEAPVCHPSTMLRREALDAVGGFHDGPFAEDYDLWLRLVAAGWGIAKIPRVLFRWRIHAKSVTFTDARLSIESHRRLRARHLARRIDRPFGVWGAGPTGRRLARELEAHDRRAQFFIDIDPRKIGRIARGVPILDPDEGIARALREHALLVVAVAAPGARDLVRDRLDADGLSEGGAYVCAA